MSFGFAIGYSEQTGNGRGHGVMYASVDGVTVGSVYVLYLHCLYCLMIAAYNT